MKYCWNCNCKVKAVVYANLSKPTVCPQCGVQFPEKPLLEITFMKLQDEFLKNRTAENFSKLYDHIKSVTTSLIYKKLKVTSAYITDERFEVVLDFAMDKILMYYNNPDFIIRDSLCGYMQKVILYPLYSKKFMEQAEIQKSTLSLNQYLSNYTNRTLENLIKDDTNEDITLDSIDYDSDRNNDKNQEPSTEKDNQWDYTDVIRNIVGNNLSNLSNTVYSNTHSMWDVITCLMYYKHKFELDDIFTNVTVPNTSKDSIMDTLKINDNNLYEELKEGLGRILYV